MASPTSTSAAIDRQALVAWYRRNRDRTRTLFDLLLEDTYYTRPIALRHPIVFYEGHLPAFSFNTLVRKGLGGASIDPKLEVLFARGIDPSEESDPTNKALEWPSRATVQEFAEEADRRVIEALTSAEIEQPGHALLDRADAAFAILEHEAMHQETLLYMWHQLPLAQKRKPVGYRARVDSNVPRHEWIEVPPGHATLGVPRDAIPFGWDNEFPFCREPVERFSIARHDVTNAAFLEFVEAGGYRQERWWHPEDWMWVQKEAVEHPQFWTRQDGQWLWRGMFDVLPLPLSWPVFVSYGEASAFAAWSGARLPTEAEFQRAAYGTPDGTERPYPWGTDSPGPHHGVFDFASWDPEPAGSHASSRSAWGIDDLVGNGWEWTSTVFGPFPGFHPIPSYPEYSADFFDGQHFVMKGASPVTARELIRPSFRNWFRSRYPYVYATFRCARDAR
jgi:ergothioneine biosynthesis protein EgtB